MINFSAYLCYTVISKGSKPVACCFLDTELEAKIGGRGFRVCNSSIQLVSVNLLQVKICNPILMRFVLFDTE